MFSANGTWYTEEHSVSFGEILTISASGSSYSEFFTNANTWTDWHLIPSSRPSIEPPTVVTKFIEVPGTDGVLDLSTYLTGRQQYGQRTGNLQFLIDNNHEYYEAIRERMVRLLHGKRIGMRLMDDPMYYYTGRFTVGKVEPGASYSSISIGYQLDPYKLRVNTEGTTPQLWDTFNFDKDYDYSVIMTPITVSGGEMKAYPIYTNDYSFAPIIRSSTGGVTASFGGVSATPVAGAQATLGYAIPNITNTLLVEGTGSITILWRGGSL